MRENMHLSSGGSGIASHTLQCIVMQIGVCESIVCTSLKVNPQPTDHRIVLVSGVPNVILD
jgi:hypothetical protein